MTEYITIRGKKYPFKVGYLAFKKIKEKTGKEWSEALKTSSEFFDQLEIHETILYSALKIGAWEEGQELDLKEDEMEMALSSCFTEYLELLGSGKFYPGVDQIIDSGGEEEVLGKEEQKEQPI